MKKSQKKYHLAVSFNKYPEIAQLPSPKPTPRQKGKDTRGYDSLENMFNNNFEMRLRKLEIQQKRNYEVVGYREIQDIHLRLERKKKLLKSGTGTKEDKQAQPTRTSIVRNNLDFLTKDEVIRHFSPNYLTSPSSRRSKERATDTRSLNTSKVMTKEVKTMCSQSKKHNNSLNKEFSICKLRQKMEEYQSGWIRQIEHKRKLVKKAMKTSENPMISVIESVDQYRASSEEREKTIIEAKILTPSIWEKILRTSQEVGNIKEITNISANGLKSIGRDKYRKELEWLEDKDKNGYFFKKDRSLVEYSQVCCE